MIKHILIPIDFSECSLNAVEFALQFAKQMNPEAQITMLHAYSIPLAYADYNLTYNLGKSEAEITQYIESEFKELEKSLPSLNDFNYTKVAVENHVKEAIQNFSFENNVDFIIMGTKGTSGVDEVILGTNAHRIVNAQIAPVLVVPKEASSKLIKNIAVLNDYKGIKPSLLKPIKDLRSAFNSNIHVLHISRQPMLDNKKAEEAKTLELHLKGLPHRFHFIVNERIEDGLEAFSASNEIDLLVVFPRKKGLIERLFVKSKSKSIIFHTKVPLLALSEYKKIELSHT